MALIVEDGSIVPNADSYVSLAEIDTFNDNYVSDPAWDTATDQDQEVAARQATLTVDSCFTEDWIGTLVENDQSLDWPRSNAVASNGRTYADNEIPKILRDACSKLAITALSEELLPDQENPGTIKKTKNKVAVIEEEIEYFGASQQKLFTLAQKLLSPLLVGGSSGQSQVARS